MRKDETYTISTDKRVITDGKFKKLIKKIPLIRGLFALFSAAPILIIAMLPMFFVDFMPYGGEGRNIALMAANIVSLGVLVYLIKRILLRSGNTRQFHGAEHKTIYAFDIEMELTLENVRSCPRVAKRCGTNLAVFMLLFFAVFSMISGFVIEVHSSIQFLVSYAFAYELFDLKNGEKIPVIKLFFKLGNWCQQHLFTREPTDIQIIASIETVNKLIELEENFEENEDN